MLITIADILSPADLEEVRTMLGSMRFEVGRATAGWSATRELPRALVSTGTVSVPTIPDARTYAFNSPNSGTEAGYERDAATRIASHVPIDRPHLAFVNRSVQGAFDLIPANNAAAHSHNACQVVTASPGVVAKEAP